MNFLLLPGHMTENLPTCHKPCRATVYSLATMRHYYSKGEAVTIITFKTPYNINGGTGRHIQYIHIQYLTKVSH